MSGLNREQIIKALECFHDRVLKTHLADDIRDGEIMAIINALSLIKELTEKYENLEMQFREIDHECDRLEIRNEELTEELEATFGQYTAYQGAATQRMRELTEENERLSAEVSVKKKLLDKCVDLEDKVKSDTVRKMHSEIEARCIKGGIYPAFVKSTIDQIAKEMVEGV